MTPQRQAYLAKCSDKEKLIRRMLLEAECMIIVHKATLNEKEYLFRQDGEKVAEYALNRIREAKIIANAYRHELAKIKGMDRVVRVKNTYLDCYGSDCFECKCGHEVEINFYECCPLCGRKILLEKVKQCD